ncbi:MAG: hypothetical protein [Wendovervirus sonii]|uniref:Uncharacterized protein n=1 Tax=phage Lak_Megaphage_Sonny TaxID=3109229 RepID=A0ABZ0Z3D9_9CAUD|nr:MAG: hypothetical protein [phage Lak_Megaphage_Sonny]
METTYKQNNTYKQFKNWVKTLCMSNKYYFFKTNTYHAIFSAYYIFKHHLKGQEIDEFLDKDFNASIKAWIRYGSVRIDGKHSAVSYDMNEISEKLSLDVHFDLNRLNINQGRLNAYIINNKDEKSIEAAKECWKENVMAIYDAWHEKELKEIEFKRPSYYAFKQSFLDKYKKLDNLSSAENILWYCIKHNLSIEQAEKYINETVSKRTHPDKMGCYCFINLKNNFFLKDIFYANNDFFKVCEESRVMRIINESDIYKNNSMQYYYTMSHMDPARRMVTYTYYVTADDKHGHYNFNDLFIGDKKYEAIQKLLECYEKCPELKFTLYKYCNYSEYTTKVEEFMKISDNQYATKKRQDLIIDSIEPIHMEIKSSSSFRLEYYNGDFEKMKNDYANILMFIFMIFKCLDYIDYTAYANTVEYAKYCSPIYKTLDPVNASVNKGNPSIFKKAIKNIFK